MKIKILSISLLIASLSQAQTMHAPNIPETGVSYPVSIKNDTINISTQGDWDFSNVTTNSDNNVMISPISIGSNFSNNYPNATHVKYEDGDKFFLGFDSTAYTFHGEISVLTSSYPSPLVIHPYPFNVGDTHTDSEFNISFTIPNGPPFLERDDQVFTEALSSGNITMPDGTVHNNAILVHTTRTWTDGQIGSSPCITSLDAYHLWIMGYAIPVVQTSIMTQTGQCPPSSPVKVTKFLKGDPFASLKDFSSPIISVYPNPAKTNIFLNSNLDLSGTQYEIYDKLGRTVYSGIINSDNTSIDISSLTNGLYLLNLKGNKTQTLKFIKE